MSLFNNNLNIISNVNLSFDEFLKKNSKSIENLFLRKDQMLTKWGDIIIKYLDINLDKDRLLNISIYLEIYLSYHNYTGTPADCRTVLNDIKTNISKNLKDKRSPVKGKVFNYETGRLEYELEDGNFIQINDENVTPPPIDIDNKIFPLELIKYIDLDKYRDIKIDKII